MFTFKHPKVKGEITITFPESEDSGIPEIDYNSFQNVGSGEISDIYNAIKLAKKAIKIYREETGYTGEITYHVDDRDGYGKQREKLFSKHLPELTNSGFYNLDSNF